jgi:hypothetical protein
MNPQARDTQRLSELWEYFERKRHWEELIAVSPSLAWCYACHHPLGLGWPEAVECPSCGADLDPYHSASYTTKVINGEDVLR